MDSEETLFETAYAEAVRFAPRELPIFRLFGADVGRYLHGRVTQDIKKLAVGAGARSLVLTPQGRIQGQMLVLRRGEDFLIISDPLPDAEAREDFIRAVLQFKVADDVKVEERTPNLCVVSVVGPLMAERLTTTLPEENFFHLETELYGIPVTFVRHQRGKLDGVDILVEHERSFPLLAALRSIPEASATVFEMIRIAERVPVMGADLSENVLGPEIKLDELASFNKGCYAGQEVVEMATARGRPNRQFLLFESIVETSPEDLLILRAGAEIALSSDPEKRCGNVTAVIRFPKSGRILSSGFVKTAAAEAEHFLAGGLPVRRI